MANAEGLARLGRPLLRGVNVATGIGMLAMVALLYRGLGQDPIASAILLVLRVALLPEGIPRFAAGRARVSRGYSG